MIRYATVCSGVEAMSLAVQVMDWKPVFFSEIEPFPCALLKYRFPDVPNLGDITKIDGGKYNGTIDVFAGGTPCQAFSVAGKRQGLDDPRGMLSIHFAKLAYECGSRWIVWENVAGVLSQDDGKAFASFLSCLAGYSVRVPRDGWKNFGVITGGPNTYGLAYRVLDSQYCRVDGLPYAVPQRRRRVWVVGYLGDWRRAVEVLFEQSSLYGNPPTRIRTKKETSNGIKGSAGVSGKTVSGKDVFPTLLSNCGDKQWLGNQEAFSGDYFVKCYENHANDSRVTGPHDVSPMPTARMGTGGGNVPLVGPGVIAINTKQQSQNIGDDVANSLGANDYKEPQAVCFPSAISFERRMVRTTGGQPQEEIVGCLRADANTGDGAPCVAITDVLHGDKACNGKGWNDDGSAYTLDTMATQAVCTVFSLDPLGGNSMKSSNPNSGCHITEVSKCLDTTNPCPSKNQGGHAIVTASTVRRLTPTECERLMGFPDNWTKMPWKGKTSDKCPDAPRYKACGNSWAVNCARWVMQRIDIIENRLSIG